MTLLIQYMLIFASVLLLVALGGCFSEHSGVINIGLEGIMVIGALGGALVMKYMAGANPAALVLCTLLGSILFGVVISKVFFHDDVRNHGSGNGGMTNVLRTFGKAAAAGTALGDVGKSVAAVLIGQWLFDVLLSGSGDALWAALPQAVCGGYLAAIFAMIGHSRPVFFGFKGGKSVLTGAGAALTLSPVVCGVLFLVFLAEFAITRIVSLGSIIIAALFPVGTLCYWAWQGANTATLVFVTVCAAFMGGMVIWLHRSNIQRLKNGTEYRFGSKNPQK